MKRVMFAFFTFAAVNAHPVKMADHLERRGYGYEAGLANQDFGSILDGVQDPVLPAVLGPEALIDANNPELPAALEPQAPIDATLAGSPGFVAGGARPFAGGFGAPGIVGGARPFAGGFGAPGIAGGAPPFTGGVAAPGAVGGVAGLSPVVAFVALPTPLTNYHVIIGKDSGTLNDIVLLHASLSSPTPLLNYHIIANNASGTVNDIVLCHHSPSGLDYCGTGEECRDKEFGN
ncbi:MAG: hypothetical protein SGCHY_002046 [Lobulomycetales sp.]